MFDGGLVSLQRDGVHDLIEGAVVLVDVTILEPASLHDDDLIADVDEAADVPAGRGMRRILWTGAADFVITFYHPGAVLALGFQPALLDQAFTRSQGMFRVVAQRLARGADSFPGWVSGRIYHDGNAVAVRRIEDAFLIRFPWDID